MDIWAYAEGGSIRFYPTEGFHVNNSVGQIDLWGRYDINGEHEDIDGKISIGNTKLTKPDSSDPEADPFITSDIYRILKQMKAVINKLADKILLLPTALTADYGSCAATAIWASETALMLETELLEFKARVEALFEPIDGKDIHEGTDEED